MTVSSQVPTHQAITPSRGYMVEVMGDINLVSTILKKLSVREISKMNTTSRVWNEASKDILKKIKQFLDTLTKLKDDKVISEELFPEISEDTFLKSPNPIVCETFLNSLTQFKEIAAKIKTQIEAQQNTNPEIDIDKLNHLKNKFLESLIFKPHIIGTINQAKIGLHQTSDFCYLGEIKNEKANGYGAFTWPNGASYVGNFENNLPIGQGTHTYANGDKYEGAWENGEYHGQGRFTWSNGNTYVGHWKNGLRHGQGTFKSADGDTYVGHWKNGLRHGQGTHTYANGDTYNGDFSEGMFHGQGTFIRSNGSVSVETWVNGKLYKMNGDIISK